MNAVLKAASLRKAWSAESVLFEHLHFAVSAGQTLWVTGESGCGKSTLLRCLCRLENLSLESSDRCELWMGGKNVIRTRAHQLPLRVIWVPAQPFFFRPTFGEDFDFFLAHAAHSGNIFDRQQLLQRLQLPKLSPDTATHQLSLGQAKRVCLVRSLLTKPQLLLIDEPLSNLDEGNRQAVLDLLRDYCAEGGAVIATAHHAPTNVDGTPVLELKLEIKL